uniref:Uncharacterized protein n=1 Tax=Anguilla anguilla TaxID=7936 RepID=A0A0E9W8C4_ANGAN
MLDLEADSKMCTCHLFHKRICNFLFFVSLFLLFN